MSVAEPDYGIDLSDLPNVSADRMRDALCLLTFANVDFDPPKVLSDAQEGAFIEAFWRRHDGSGIEGLALSFRLLAMLRAMPSRQLRPQFLADYEMTLAASADVAASLRLNPRWGFNPMRFICEVRHRALELKQLKAERVMALPDQIQWRIAA
jgi:hypothetical protein